MVEHATADAREVGRPRLLQLRQSRRCQLRNIAAAVFRTSTLRDQLARLQVVH